ncbi:hypothetical protein J4404_02625 [Candidatus Woesearchaeota archaeon]|nr:hypothetical protein [Candidatus Woesearchaeota archaeon]
MERRLEDNLEYGIPIHGLVKAFNEDTSSEFKSFLVTYNIMNAGIIFYVTYSLIKSFLK